MQTVVMSFGRNQCLGKPDLPIYHVHVYFPVQLVHKLIERMETLNLQNVTPEEGKRYKHNSENEANNPYIIVGSYEGLCVSNDYPEVPQTPKLANAYEQGILDGSFGQMVSFQSSYKSAFRLEVPMWHKVNEGVASAKGDSDVTAKTGMAEPVPAMGAQTPAPMGNRQEETEAATDPGSEEGDAEDETYLVPIGQGCFSFQQGLLLRAKETYSKRSIGNKYELISKWLLTGLAVVITRTNWNPGAGHGPVSLPEAFGWQPKVIYARRPCRRPPPPDPRPNPVDRCICNVYVSCAGCSKNVQKHRFLQCFVAFGVHDRVPVVSVMRAARTDLIDISWVLGTEVALHFPNIGLR